MANGAVIFVDAKAAVALLRELGVSMTTWRLYQLSRDGHFSRGRVVLREGPRKLLFRVDGLREWVDNGGTLAGLPEPVPPQRRTNHFSGTGTP